MKLLGNMVVVVVVVGSIALIGGGKSITAPATGIEAQLVRIVGALVILVAAILFQAMIAVKTSEHFVRIENKLEKLMEAIERAK